MLRITFIFIRSTDAVIGSGNFRYPVIDILSGYTGSDPFCNVIKDKSINSACFPDAFNLFRRLDVLFLRNLVAKGFLIFYFFQYFFSGHAI